MTVYGAGFSLWGFVHAITKSHRLKPAPLMRFIGVVVVVTYDEN
jgi:hypothetical protein